MTELQDQPWNDGRPGIYTLVVEEVNGMETGEYVREAVKAFVRAALDDASWFGDTEGTGEDPLDFGAYQYEPIVGNELDGAYNDPAESPETQIENVLTNARAVEIINDLHIDARTFGDRLYYDQNGHGIGFWDMDFSDSRYRELSDIVGNHPWSVIYDYIGDPNEDPDVTLKIMN